MGDVLIKPASFSRGLPDPLIFRQAPSRLWGMSPACRVQHAPKQGEGSKDGGQHQPGSLHGAPAPLQASLDRRRSVLQLNPSLPRTSPSGRLFFSQEPRSADTQSPVLLLQPFRVFSYCIGCIWGEKIKANVSALGYKCLFPCSGEEASKRTQGTEARREQGLSTS